MSNLALPPDGSSLVYGLLKGFTPEDDHKVLRYAIYNRDFNSETRGIFVTAEGNWRTDAHLPQVAQYEAMIKGFRNRFVLL